MGVVGGQEDWIGIGVQKVDGFVRFNDVGEPGKGNEREVEGRSIRFLDSRQFHGKQLKNAVGIQWIRHIKDLLCVRSAVAIHICLAVVGSNHVSIRRLQEVWDSVVVTVSEIGRQEIKGFYRADVGPGAGWAQHAPLIVGRLCCQNDSGIDKG